VSACFFIASLVCLIFGLVHFFRGPLDTPLAISLIFMVRIKGGHGEGQGLVRLLRFCT
jgi:hypothetical protein